MQFVDVRRLKLGRGDQRTQPSHKATAGRDVRRFPRVGSNVPLHRSVFPMLGRIGRKVSKVWEKARPEEFLLLVACAGIGLRLLAELF